MNHAKKNLWKENEILDLFFKTYMVYLQFKYNGINMKKYAFEKSVKNIGEKIDKFYNDD